MRSSTYETLTFGTLQATLTLLAFSVCARILVFLKTGQWPTLNTMWLGEWLFGQKLSSPADWAVASKAAVFAFSLPVEAPILAIGLFFVIIFSDSAKHSRP